MKKYIGYIPPVFFLTFYLIVNPVWPQSWDWRDHNEMILGCRVGGVLVILIGLITRFVV